MFLEFQKRVKNKRLLRVSELVSHRWLVDPYRILDPMVLSSFGHFRVGVHQLENRSLQTHQAGEVLRSIIHQTPASRVSDVTVEVTDDGLGQSQRLAGVAKTSSYQSISPSSAQASLTFFHRKTRLRSSWPLSFPAAALNVPSTCAPIK